MSHSHCVKRYCVNRDCTKREGLTLIELVVVLGILAILSSLAVRSLEPIADQARYEATQRLMDDLRGAICGEANSASRPMITGYVADTGVLPTTVAALLTRPNSLIDHSWQTFDSDRDATDDVSLASGWRGPYLQLGAGHSDVRDGWGRLPTLTPTVSGLNLLSQGSDGDSIAPEDDYRADLLVPIVQRDYASDIVCRLFAIDSQSGLRIDPSTTGTQRLGVLFYAVNANGGTDGSIEEQLLIVPASGSFDVRRSDTIQGTVAMRAILWDDVNSNQTLDIGESIVKKSYVHTHQVLPGVDTRVEMELR